MLKKKNTKTSATSKILFRNSKNEKKFLVCKECNRFGIEVSQDISAIICAYCVQRHSAPPPQIKPPESKDKFPRGWALRATYIHIDGRIFEKGQDTGRTYVPTNPESKVEFIPLSKKKFPKQQKKKVKTKKAKRRKKNATISR